MTPGWAVDPARGVLSIGGSRYLCLRPETLAPLCASDLPAVGELLYAGGVAGGSAAAAGALSAGRRGRGALEHLLGFGAEIGWGRFTLDAWGEDRVAVTLAESPFARAAGPSSHPVCHTVRGVLAGMVSSLRGVSYEAVETACGSTGAPRCTFALRPAGAGER